MQPGYVISGAAHAGLIGWLLFGSFSIPPEPAVEVTNVAMISNEEYAAIIASQEPPGATTEVEAPEAPEPETPGTPDVSGAQDAQPEQTEPAPTEAAEQDPVPEQPDPTPPAPEEVADEAPVIEQPSEDIAALPPEPRPDPEAAPRDVPRVAPQPVVRPEPDVQVDDEVRQSAEAADDAEIQQEEQEATAPEEATTEIVTEAEKDRPLAPSVSKRPQARPQRQQAAVEPEEAPAPETPAEPEAPASDNAAVNAALEKALGGGEAETPAPSGPPLTSGEKDALRVAVSNCWNTGSLSSDALRVTVVVSVSMQEDGRPNVGSIRMESSSGGSDSAARQAFEAARRAIIRCGTSGYDLPREKYGQWRDIEMTFNPEKMRIK